MGSEQPYRRSIEQIAEIARGAQRSIVYLLLAGLAASVYIAWSLYSPNAPLWWNTIVCTVIMLPALVWSLVWMVLQQLQSAPRLMSQLTQQPDGVFNNLHQLSLKKEGGLRGVFNTLKAFREQEGLDSVLETVGGVSLIANPLFAIVAVICAGILMLLILVASLLLIF